MSCKDNTQEMTFAVYELFPDGSKNEDYKTIKVSPQKSKEIMDKYQIRIREAIDDYAIILIVFEELYNFTIGPNGFKINWNEIYKDGFFHWIGPQAVGACR